MRQDETTLRKRSFNAIGLVLILAAGCHGSGGPAGPAGGLAPKPAATDPPPDPALTEANRRMAGGVPMGQGNAPVEVRFDLSSAPHPGETFRIDVAVLPEAPVPLLKVDVSGSDGLVILDPEAPVALEKVQAGSVTHVSVKASAATAGTRVVHVGLTLELPSGPETRAFAFPILVDGPAVPPPAPAAATAVPGPPKPAAKSAIKPAGKPAGR